MTLLRAALEGSMDPKDEETGRERHRRRSGETGEERGRDGETGRGRVDEGLNLKR